MSAIDECECYSDFIIMVHGVFFGLFCAGINKARPVNKILSIVHRVFQQTAASRYVLHLKLHNIKLIPFGIAWKLE